MTKSNYWRLIADNLCIAHFFAQNCIDEISNLSYEDYLENHRLRLSLQFSIAKIGDCLSQIKIYSGKIFNDLSVSKYNKSMIFLNRITYPWNSIIQTRNIVVHSYHSIDNKTIYEILINDIPSLIESLKLLENEPELEEYLQDSFEYADNVVFHPERLDVDYQNIEFESPSP